MCRQAFAGLFVALLLVGFSSDQPVRAGGKCAECGCCSHLRKVCRCVPEEKEVIKVCWDVKCEDFCVPGPSTLCGSVEECDECGSWCRNIWKPGCAKVYTRKVPVKKEVKRKVKTWKWEVVTICDSCRRCCDTKFQDLNPSQQLAAQVQEAITGEEVAEIPSPLAPVVKPVNTSRMAAKTE